MAAALKPVLTPAWTLTYRGVAITARIESMVLGVTYTSHPGGAASSLEVEIEDRDKRWQGAWFPQRGDLVAAAIGYAGATVSCGNFEVDEVELGGPPDVVHLRCVAAYISAAIRTRNSAAYEGQTLLGIAGTVAAKHGLTVVGAAVNPDVSFARVSQHQETDLAFLERLAREHDYDFTVRGKQLVFYSRPALEQRSAVAIVRRHDVTRFSFKARTHKTYKGAQVAYQDPATKTLIAQTAAGDAPTGDTVKLATRVENGQQAALKAAAALHRHNMLLVTGELTLPGTTAISAGVVVTLAGFGAYDGNYMVTLARHRLARASGYTTEIELRQVV